MPGFVLSIDSVGGGDVRSSLVTTEVDSDRSKLLLIWAIGGSVEVVVVVQDSLAGVEFGFASLTLLLVLFAFANKA